MTEIFLIILTIYLIASLLKIFFDWLDNVFKKKDIKSVTYEVSSKEKNPINNNITISNKPTTPFDDLFYYQIKVRGLNYYEDGHVNMLHVSHHKYRATVLGSENYDVSITFNYNEKEIKKMTCTCPYFTEQGQNCKHMYATLCCIEKGKNSLDNSNQSKLSLINQLMDILDDMQNIIDDAKDFDSDEDNELYDEISDYEDVISKYQNIKAMDITGDTVLQAKSDLEDLEDLYAELTDYMYEENEDTQITSNKDSHEKDPFNDYEDFNFEEEDLEEDDYYFEDDD